MSQKYATVNPCSMCMPMGSVMVFRGVDGAMPMFHGSQGCSTYMRLYLAHHFREPVDIASSALSEKGAVYGGAANLKTGLKNVIMGYHPKLIGVATTCLAETIGDDVGQIIREFVQEEPLTKDVAIVSSSTPSYSGSHEEGYVETLKAIVQALATKTNHPNGKFNLLIGSIISPAEVRYIKTMLDDWGCGYDYILLPDISETFDAPLVDNYPKIPEGGTCLGDIRDMANSKETITIGGLVQDVFAGDYLERAFRIPNTNLPLPIGVEYTDRFVANIEKVTGLVLPDKYEKERGRLLDAMVDAHKYLAEVKVVIFGDSEMALGVTKFLCEVGMNIVIVATGADNPGFVEVVRAISPQTKVLYGANFDDIQTEVKENRVDLMIGTSNGRHISKSENIPLVRIGLPNHDRVGASRQLILGYEGAMRFLDTVTNSVLEERERS